MTDDELLAAALHDAHPPDEVDPAVLYHVPEDQRLDHDEHDPDIDIAGFTDLSHVDPDEGDVVFMDEP